MVAIRQSRGGSTSMIGWSGVDGSVTNLEANCPFSSQAWGTASREFNAPVQLTSFHFMCREVINTNVSDGALFATQIDLIDVNQVLVIDQATGVFVDLTNSDVIPQQARLGVIYREGSVGGALNVRSAGWAIR